MKVRPIIIGITGSTGKTSFRDASKLVLETKYKVKATDKANSESGIPLDILGLQMESYSIFDWIRVCVLAPIKLLTNWEQYDVYVVEMGVDSPKSPKNMGYLLTIVKPQIGVLLNVSAVHSEQYDHLVEGFIGGKERNEKIVKLIAQEKGKMLESIKKDGFSIGNIDDPNVEKVLSECRSNIISFGKKESSDIRIILSSQENSTFCTKLVIDKISYTIELKNTYLSEAYSYIFAGAMAIAKALNVDLGLAINALETYSAPAGRMSVFPGIKDALLIDSSYNASRLSVLESFKLVTTLSKNDKSKVILALGDMREMGDETEIEHERIASEAVKISDRLVLVGPLMEKYFYPKVQELGFPKEKIFLFEKSSEAGTFIQSELLKSKDVVLVKGSQNTIFMENIVEQLLKNSKDKGRLCRRGKYWDKIRSKY